MRKFALAFMVMAAPAQAAEWAHCYTGEAPEDAKLSTQSPPPMEKFAEYLGIAAIRHACDADTTLDRTLMEQELKSAECSSMSEIAEYAGVLMSTPVDVLSNQYAQQLNMTAEEFQTFCASLSACEPDETDAYGPDCAAALQKAIGG